MTRIAVIDLGTNSIRLLVAEAGKNGQMKALEKKQAITRLGEGMAGGYLLPEAIERTINAAKSYLNISRLWQAEKIIPVATSAVRDAVNQAHFLALMRKETGLKVCVLSGREEALYSYSGVLAGLPLSGVAPVVVDIGGGSTEFSWKVKEEMFSASVRAGAVRMTENPSSDKEIKDILTPALKEVHRASPQILVGVGGTVTALAAMAQKLKEYDSNKVHGYTLLLKQVEQILITLKNFSFEERRTLPGVQPERADIIEAGGRIVRIIMEDLGLGTLKVSETDLLYGLAREKAFSVG
jgi:exopolyphosphatase/guanosine-5'-triphosphate,3'-diphosphate pyrophosphatase